VLKASKYLRIRDCDEGVLVFDESSGKTSLLNHQGALALSALSPEHGVDEAVARLASNMDKEDDSQAFQDLISSLENSGLIVRC
jgi:hypothetical protein